MFNNTQSPALLNEDIKATKDETNINTDKNFLIKEGLKTVALTR
jgi:hypothetical protein